MPNYIKFHNLLVNRIEGVQGATEVHGKADRWNFVSANIFYLSKPLVGALVGVWLIRPAAQPVLASISEVKHNSFTAA